MLHYSNNLSHPLLRQVCILYHHPTWYVSGVLLSSATLARCPTQWGHLMSPLRITIAARACFIKPQPANYTICKPPLRPLLPFVTCHGALEASPKSAGTNEGVGRAWSGGVDVSPPVFFRPNPCRVHIRSWWITYIAERKLERALLKNSTCKSCSRGELADTICQLWITCFEVLLS